LGDESEVDMEAGTTSTADFPADTVDDCPEGRATDNNRSLLPTTSRRLLESRPTGNIDSAIAHPPLFAASV
jgi:hypothetical protein